MRKVSLGILLSFIALTSLSCEKNKSQKFASTQPTIIAPTCGTIDMTPQHSLYSHIPVNFEVIPPRGVILTDVQWTFKKENQIVYAANTLTVSRLFNGPEEGYGAYTASAVFTKTDGNVCILEKSFQILKDDVCVQPSGISGPRVGYVGEETSPFTVHGEPCFQGRIDWDMDDDGATDYTLSPNQLITHTFQTTGLHTIRAWVFDFEDDAPYVLTHEIEIKNKSCLNPFTNAVVAHGTAIVFARESSQCGQACEKAARTCLNGQFDESDDLASYTLNPATCSAAPACPATYSWQPSEFGKCTGPCDSAEGTQDILNYTCQKTLDDSASVAPDLECLTSIGPKPTGETQSCTVLEEDLALNCLSCGDIPHNTTITRWAKNSQCGQKCISQQRTCANGNLPNFEDGFIYESEGICPVEECPPLYTYSWKVGEWSACSETACGKEGKQTRSVTCVRNDGLPVLDLFCTDTKPATSQPCTARPCQSCELPWGGTIAHNESVTAYKDKQVTFGNSCVSQVRTCKDGSLSGSYKNQSCQVGDPAPCTLDGVTIPHGQSHVFYFAATVACGQTCASQTRTCYHGKFDGNASYNKAVCKSQACSYKWVSGDWSQCSVTACGQTGVQTRSVTCQRSDGTTVADSFCSSPKPDTSKTCTTRACYSCQLPWGGTIVHNTEVTAFKDSTVECGQTCQSEKRKCLDGQLSGTFKKQSCSIKTCETDSCTISNVVSTCAAVINDPSQTHYRIAPLNWRFFHPTDDAFSSGKVASFNPFSGGTLSSGAIKHNKKTGAITVMTNGMRVEKDEVMYCYNYYDDTSRQFIRHSPALGYVLLDVPDSDYTGISPLPNATCRYPPPKTLRLGTSATMKCTSTGAIPDPAQMDSKNRILWENFHLGGHCAY